jgi:hypothetical protein
LHEELGGFLDAIAFKVHEAGDPGAAHSIVIKAGNGVERGALGYLFLLGKAVVPGEINVDMRVLAAKGEVLVEVALDLVVPKGLG